MVLVIEDDEDDFFIASNLLSKATNISCKVDWAKSYEEGLNAVSAQLYDVCLVDYRLGARNGLELLREAAENGARTPMILLTGQGDIEVDLNAMMAGAADYLVKGQIDAQVLERSIRYARERKRAEERIREQAALLDKARDAISAYDLDRNVIYWNKSAERMTGYSAEAVAGGPTDALLYRPDDPELAEAWRAVFRQGEWVGELKQYTQAKQELTVESRWTLVRDAQGNPQSVLVINTDITERKKLETQFLRSQRMESIGRLVGGIAHDLGNLLVPILLGVKVLQQRLEGDEKSLRTLSMIQKSAQRGADMVKQVLTFARGVEGERVPMTPTPVIREVEKITQETFPVNIKIAAEVAPDLWAVKGDATQIQQVLMNLCVNARDVMPDGGALTIRAENAVVGEEQIHANIEAQPGSYVCISVEDTGSGIPPEVLDKIFEPFYTTKAVGKGTGLGLSTVYSIMKAHGGFIQVASEVGKGSRFAVYLPTTGDKTFLQTEELDTDLYAGNGELVLVIDDEPYILETVSDLLDRAGYRVITAADGAEGLALFKERLDKIDLVVTDLMMPHLDGVATIKAMKSLRPNLPIVAATGVTGARAREAVEAGAHTCLSKPFTTEKLCSTLREMLQPAA